MTSVFMNTIHIRPAHVADAPAIACIHVEAWKTAYRSIFPEAFLSTLSLEKRTASWEQQLSGKTTAVLLAETSTGIAGWIAGGDERGTTTEGQSEIHALYVAPAQWRRGIGSRLIREMELLFSHCTGISLWVLRDNHAAIRFYLQAGYAADGMQKTIERGKTSAVEIRMTKAVRLP